MKFSCTASQAADHVVLAVAGDVDLAAYPRFEAALEQSWDASTDIVIDCSAVTFLDSMGLRALVRARQRAADQGRDVVLAAPSRPVLRVLELAGVTSLFPLAKPDPDVQPKSNAAA